jgi:hypothetical protein
MNELYSDEVIIFDSVYKYGMIFINNLNKDNNESIKYGILDITGITIT